MTQLKPADLHHLLDSFLNDLFRRMSKRLSSITAEESMVTITEEFAAHVHTLHVQKDVTIRLNGDRTKLLMVTFPFICRDLAFDEVQLIEALQSLHYECPF